MEKRKIVFLDRKSIGSDLDLSEFESLGEIVNYDFTTAEQTAERAKDADVLVLNKTLINEQTLGEAPRLKLICVTATGTNNLDKDFLERRGIAWRNVAGYSTESVAQHTFALLFYLLEQLPYYDHYVKSGSYMEDQLFTHFGRVFHEMSGQTWGIVGLGTIGRRVAQLADCFGCRVQYYSTSGNHHTKDWREVGWEELLSTSDIISIHAPLNERTYHLFDQKAFSKMKSSAILINVGRGPILVEEDLAEALEDGVIRAAGLDVLDVEPMSRANPLARITDSSRLLITPHIAWATVEARRRLMDIICRQIRDFFAE